MAIRTLKERTISGIIWVSVQKFGSLSISFIANMILARILTPNDYGMIGMLAIFISISQTLIDGGFGSALIQKSRPNQTDYSTVFYFNILLSISLYVLLFISAPWIEQFYKNITGLSAILRIQGIIIILNALTIVQFNKLRKLMNFKLLSRINIFSALFGVIVALVMAKLKFGVWSLVFQQIAFSVANVCQLWLICKWKPSGWMSIKSLKELFGFGSFIMFSSLLNSLGNNINGLLIGKFFSPSTLGYFSQAKKIEDLSSTGILSVVEQVTYPMLVEVKDNSTKMTNVLAKFNNLLLAVVMPFMLCLLLTARPIIIILFSEKWLLSVPILQILAIHGIFICMQGSNYNAIAAIGKSKILFKWTIIKRITNLGILIVSLLIWGFDGLMWGIVLTGVVITGCNMYLVDLYIGFKTWHQVKLMTPIIITALIPFIPCYIMMQSYHLKTVSTQALDMSLGGLYLICYMLLIYVLPVGIIKDIKIELINLFNNK